MARLPYLDAGDLREEDRDELDRFHASANKLSLRLQDDAAAMPTGEDSGDELGVLDLGPASSDEEQEDDDAQLREMARARKAVKSRLLRQQAADEEEEEEEAGPGDGWGRRKEAYYDDGDEEVRACVRAAWRPRAREKRACGG